MGGGKSLQKREGNERTLEKGKILRKRGTGNYKLPARKEGETGIRKKNYFTIRKPLYKLRGRKKARRKKPLSCETTGGMCVKEDGFKKIASMGKRERGIS